MLLEILPPCRRVVRRRRDLHRSGGAASPKQIDIAAALAEWRPSYKRAAVVQPLLAGLGS
jgi:hypothetical protein